MIKGLQRGVLLAFRCRTYDEGNEHGEEAEYAKGAARIAQGLINNDRGRADVEVSENPNQHQNLNEPDGWDQIFGGRGNKGRVEACTIGMGLPE